MEGKPSSRNLSKACCRVRRRSLLSFFVPPVTESLLYPFTTSSNKGLELTKPLHPYLAKPYQYVSPYVKKADSLGDSTLSTIDSKFPYVKTPTGEIYENGKSIVFFPLKKGNETKDYVFGTYKGEVKKVGGEGIVTYGKAAVATGLIVGGDAYSFLVSFLGAKKAEAKEVAKEKTSS